MAAIVTLDEVTVTFPGASSPIFSGIDFSANKGEFVIIVGTSGAGKSTLLRVVAGLLEPTAGTVHRAIEESDQRRASAMVFQEAHLMPWRTVRDNVALGLEGLNLTEQECERRITDALALVRLSEYGGRWPHELSGGQRQRIGLARALAVEPELLLMDEPFSALDAITRQALQDELLSIWAATGKSILFVTHDIDEAIYLGDRVYLLGGSPACIVDSFANSAPRPRQRGTADSVALATRIKENLSGIHDHGGGI